MSSQSPRPSPLSVGRLALMMATASIANAKRQPTPEEATAIMNDALNVVLQRASTQKVSKDEMIALKRLTLVHPDIYRKVKSLPVDDALVKKLRKTDQFLVSLTPKEAWKETLRHPMTELHKVYIDMKKLIAYIAQFMVVHIDEITERVRNIIHRLHNLYPENTDLLERLDGLEDAHSSEIYEWLLELYDTYMEDIDKAVVASGGSRAKLLTIEGFKELIQKNPEGFTMWVFPYKSLFETIIETCIDDRKLESFKNQFRHLTVFTTDGGESYRVMYDKERENAHVLLTRPMLTEGIVEDPNIRAFTESTRILYFER